MPAVVHHLWSVVLRLEYCVQSSALHCLPVWVPGTDFPPPTPVSCIVLPFLNDQVQFFPAPAILPTWPCSLLHNPGKNQYIIPQHLGLNPCLLWLVMSHRSTYIRAIRDLSLPLPKLLILRDEELRQNLASPNTISGRFRTVINSNCNKISVICIFKKIAPT